MSYYQLGHLPTAKDIIARAYGENVNPMTPDVLRCQKLKRDGKIAYEVAMGRFYGSVMYGVNFARINERGRVERMPRESGIFYSEAEVDGWIATIEKSSGIVS
jgi:hypothetical protein